MYVKGTVPTESCTTHVKLKICKDTGKIANEFCKNVEEKVFITRPNRDKDTSWQKQQMHNLWHLQKLVIYI